MPWPSKSTAIVTRDRSSDFCNQVGVPLEVERPAGVVGDTVAHTFPTGSVPVEVAVFEFEAGAVGRFGDEVHFDFAGVGLVGFELPVGADVPAEHDPVRRL